MHTSERDDRAKPPARLPATRSTQEPRTAAPGTNEAAAAARGGQLGPADMRAIQGSAGNTAANLALVAQRQARGAHRGHRAPVQRAGGGPSNVLSNDTREFGPGGLKPPRQEDQEHLERVFPKTRDGGFQQFPDPTATGYALVGQLTQRLNKIDPKGAMASSGRAADWVKSINPQRDEAGGAYRRNCGDAARSFLASWSGNPTVAAGVHNTGPRDVEQGGNDRTANMLRTQWRTSIREAAEGERVESVWPVVASRLKNAGHGASSVVVFQREETGLVHAVCGVNHNGKVVWIDPQLGRVSAAPMYKGTQYMSITLDPQFAPVDAPAAHPTALSLD
ncbi:toxin glutamine deamidase domain-containing protein [Streptomyces aureocirculatus]|uniref:toxin glutamine deamidase domain-containing protein n=1 Tax=Streptomyces aureocirculatus TaxID=67275 RepID=UPI0004CC7084|nr:toxin glutamine deamidase domain-containing protein [Streptomyces aureocirculatus]